MVAEASKLMLVLLNPQAAEGADLLSGLQIRRSRVPRREVMPSMAYTWTPLTCDDNIAILVAGAFQANKMK